ncbi:glycosyltransferase family 4 protein [uncultured Christiangramia sp.]|uniref:glycosyltransferase family 4 protein n=1 Tax=Christiangramia sp. 3-2217-3z TaxID=3417564 RepID=UPI002627BB57|nr:glycosyltransferase family 4 protein [uncultured Christiangramia sp.]
MIKKKILFVLDTLQGSGAERSLVEIAIRFKKFTPVFVNIYEGDMLTPILKKNNIKFYSLNVPMERNFKIAAERLAKVYEIEKPDIVHSTLFKSDAVTRILKSNYDIFLVNSFVNNNYSPLRYKELGYVQGLKLKLVQLYDAYTSRKVDFFISNSETIKEAKSKGTLVSKDKIKVIYRGRNIDSFKNINTVHNSRLIEELGLRKKIVLLNVSRLIERKGQLDLINALPLVINQYPNIQLLIAGHGVFQNKLENQIEKLQIKTHVRLLGRRQDIPDLLEISDIFIFPSYFEGLPGALIEAMLSQKIIVCSDIDENKECVDENSAIFFQLGNSRDMADKINYAINNKKELKQLGRNAREQAIIKFNIESISQEYESTYSSILSK